VKKFVSKFPSSQKKSGTFTEKDKKNTSKELPKSFLERQNPICRKSGLMI
jgi:hypothetical protein